MLKKEKPKPLSIWGTEMMCKKPQIPSDYFEKFNIITPTLPKTSIFYKAKIHYTRI